MSAFFTFALVTLLIALVLIVFAIANIVYYNKFKSGAVLTQSQLTGLVVINSLAIILLLILFFYGIFAAVGARKSDGGESSELTEVTTTKQVTTTVVTPTVVAPAVAPLAKPAVSIPSNTVLTGVAPAGSQLYRVTQPTTLNPGQYVCIPPTTV